MISMKNLLRTIIIITFGWLLIITPLFFALYAFTAKPDNFKDITMSSGVYKSAIPAAIESSINHAETEEAKSLLADPAIQQIANDVIDPAVVASASEQVIDGIHNWLVGETMRPEFTIDLTEQRDLLITNLDTYAISYVDALPICTPQQLASYNTNAAILDMPCRPAGVSAQQITSNFGAQTLAESEILQNPVFTADSLAGLNNLTDEQSANIQDKFMALKTMVISLTIIAVLLAVAIFVMTPERGHALRLIGRTLIITAIIISLMSLGTVYLFERNNAPPVGTNAVETFQASVTTAGLGIASRLNHYILWWTAGYLILGVITYILGRRLYRKPDITPTQPQT